MLYSLELSKFKNLHIILTNKFLIFITKNGIVHFTTNFYNLFILNNKIYFNFNYYSQINNNITLYYINKAFLISNFLTKTSLNYTFNYLNSFYSSLYNLFYNYKVSIYLQGVGYKFICNDNNIQIRVGYSHFVTYNIDKNIYLNLKNQTTLVLYSNNKLILQNFVSNLKLCKKTNLYKGTGIFYENELILKKKKNNNKNKNVK